MKKFFSVIILFFLGLQIAISATLSLSPSSSSVSESRNFTSTIYLNSGGQSVNAVQGVINFPNDKLQVVSVSKSSSLVDFWVKDPSYSNSAGTINFEGAIISGYSGSSGKILTVTFKPKTLGVADVEFARAQALANDGNGTDVLSGTSPARYTIIADEKPETTVVKNVATDTEVTALPAIATATEIISTSTTEVYVPQEIPKSEFSYNKQNIIYFLLILFVILILLARKYILENLDNREAEFYLANIDKEVESYLDEIKKIKVQKKMLADKEKNLKDKIKEIKSKLDKLSDK